MSSGLRPSNLVTRMSAEKRRRSVDVLACFHFLSPGARGVFARTLRSESKLGELRVEGGDGLVTSSLSAGVDLLLLALVEGSRLDLSLLLEGLDGGGLGPSSDGGELGQGAIVSVGLEAESLESVGDDHSLLHVVGEGNSLEDLKLTESIGTSW